MKRREFVGLATVFAFYGLPLRVTQEEMFRFDFSSIRDLLKKIPLAERETASLMIRNLLYDMEHIFKQASGKKTDVATLKKLAEEADRKFYSENKLKGTSFNYQPLTQTTLEAMKISTSLKPGEFDTMLKTTQYYINKIITSKESFGKLIPVLMKDADEAAQKLKEAEEKDTCTKVLSVVAAIIIIVVAVVVAAVTFGAGAVLIALAVIAAAAIIGSAISHNDGRTLLGAITGTTAGLLIVSDGRNVVEEKIKLSWDDFDKKLKCAFVPVINAVTISFFGNTSYPSNAIMGSVAVNVMAVALKLPGTETGC